MKQDSPQKVEQINSSSQPKQPQETEVAPMKDAVFVKFEKERRQNYLAYLDHKAALLKAQAVIVEFD